MGVGVIAVSATTPKSCQLMKSRTPTAIMPSARSRMCDRPDYRLPVWHFYFQIPETHPFGMASMMDSTYEPTTPESIWHIS